MAGDATDDALPLARRAAPSPALSNHPLRDQAKQPRVPDRLARSVLQMWKRSTQAVTAAMRDERQRAEVAGICQPLPRRFRALALSRAW